jgi:hypothetical protein
MRIFCDLLVPRQSYLKHYSNQNPNFPVAFFQAAYSADMLYLVHFVDRQTP